MKYENHEYATIFPMLPQADLQELADDIKANGVKEPGLLFQGKILDGRNRDKACEIAGVEMWWEEVEPANEKDFDALGHVLSKNLHRRHLDASKRAMAAARARDIFDKRAKERQKRKPDAVVVDTSPQQKARDEAGAVFGVSGKSVDRARHVIDGGCKELLAAVEASKVTVGLAEKFVKEVPDKRHQRDALKGHDDPAKAIKEYLTEPTPAASTPAAKPSPVGAGGGHSHTEPPAGYWPCACVKRDKAGNMTHFAMQPPGREKCKVCGAERPEVWTEGDPEEGTEYIGDGFRARTDDPQDAVTQEARTESEATTDGTDEEPGHEAPSLAKLLLDGDPYAIWSRKLESTWPDGATAKQKVAWLDSKICELRGDQSWKS